MAGRAGGNAREGGEAGGHRSGSRGLVRFFPRDGEHAAHAEFLKKVPNLDTFGAGEGGLWKRQIKTSLGNTLRLLRPICLIQVERTGKDQRKAGMIHAEDARDYLLKMDGVRPEHIAVKTSEKDELKEIDDTGGLMARDCEVRYIITKQALQQGWDCPFAYVLAILTNPGSKTALTQLVGRVLRQPYAVKTHVPLLDESYVFCFQRRGRDLLEEVRKGFGMEGLGDLAARVVSDMEGKASAGFEMTIDSRASLRSGRRFQSLQRPCPRRTLG